MQDNFEHNESLSILLIEDSSDDAELILYEFHRHHIQVSSTCIETREEMQYHLKHRHWDVIISDYALPRFNGLSAIAELKKSRLDIPLILVSGTIGEEMAVLAMKAGAHDYIMKDNLKRLIPAVERELREVQQREKRKKAEQAFKESEESFRKIFEDAPIGMAIINSDYSFVRFNQQLSDMFGYSKDELLTKTLLDTTHNDDLKTSQNKAKHIFSSKKHFIKSEIRFLKKNNETLWVALSLSALQKEGNKVITALAMFEDITERKQAEDVLLNIAKGVSAKTGDLFFRSLVENLAKTLHADYTFIGELAGRTNELIKTISVYAGNDFLENFSYKLKNTPCKNVLHQQMCCYPENVQKHYPEDPILKKMQIAGYVGMPLIDASGNPLGLLVVLFRKPIVHVEQTKSLLTIFAARASAELERRLAEKALRESEEKFRQIVETSQEGIWTIDAKGNTTYVNDKMGEMLGYTTAEMTGKHLFDFMDETGKQISSKNIERRKKGIQEMHEFSFLKKDGSVLHTLLSTNPLIDRNGKYTGALAMVTDISDIKKIQVALKKSEEQLRNLSAHLQNSREEDRLMIAREIHDEIGQVLTALKMDLTLMERDVDITQNSIHAETIVEEIHSMKALIDTTIKKVRKLITELRPEVLDNLGLEAALHWQIEEFTKRTGIAHSIDVKEVSLEKHKAIAVFRIFQEALTNITRHAKAKNVDVQMIHKNHSYILKIKDDGIGFPEDILEHSNTFGLLGMKERALIFGGEVIVCSKPNQGTTININIPIGA